MFNLAKPYIGPGVLIGLGATVAGIQVEWLGGGLLGVGVGWLIGVVLNHEALVRRFPRIHEWLPFVASNAGRLTAEELSSPYVTGKHFCIISFARTGVICDRVFESCVIYGPAFLVNLGGSQMITCLYDRPPERLVWVVDDDDIKECGVGVKSGLLYIQRCIFRDCTFVDIGFVGSKGFLAAMKREVTPLPEKPDVGDA
jgi:hypothetical protein